MTIPGFVVCAKAVLRATARPVCQAQAGALQRHGVSAQIFTDNGKVFTGRFGRGPGPVMFDRICADNVFGTAQAARDTGDAQPKSPERRHDGPVSGAEGRL